MTALTRALASLPTRQQEVLAARYRLGGREPETLQDLVDDTFGITREAGRQLPTPRTGDAGTPLWPLTRRLIERARSPSGGASDSASGSALFKAPSMPPVRLGHISGQWSEDVLRRSEPTPLSELRKCNGFSKIRKSEIGRRFGGAFGATWRLALRLAMRALRMPGAPEGVGRTEDKAQKTRLRTLSGVLSRRWGSRRSR